MLPVHWDAEAIVWLASFKVPHYLNVIGSFIVIFFLSAVIRIILKNTYNTLTFLFLTYFSSIFVGKKLKHPPLILLQIIVERITGSKQIEIMPTLK